MAVNFTGIENVGGMLVRTPNPHQMMNIISLQVTNDERGNDLDAFNKALEKTGEPDKYKTAFDGSISINVFSTESDSEYESTKHSFYLNGTKLKVNDTNLPVFTYLAKLTTKISNKENNDLKLNEEYVKSPDFINGSSIGYFVKQAFLANQNINLGMMLNNIFYPENAKAGAKAINSAINETMTDYFA